MKLNEALPKLIARLESACSPHAEKRSENHWTAHTWQVFFEDLNCRAILDSSGNEDNDRPDVQVWIDQDSAQGPELWVEAKLPRAFQTRNGMDEVIRQTATKLESCLRNNQPIPDEILITDFATHLIWSSDRFLKLFQRTTRRGKLISILGKPSAIFRTSHPNTLKSEMRLACARWQDVSNRQMLPPDASRSGRTDFRITGNVHGFSSVSS